MGVIWEKWCTEIEWEVLWGESDCISRGWMAGGQIMESAVMTAQSPQYTKGRNFPVQEQREHLHGCEIS